MIDASDSRMMQVSGVRKLKQSRLSFQVVSPGTTNNEAAAMRCVKQTESRKRKPSPEGLALGHVSKIVRILKKKEKFSRKETDIEIFDSEDHLVAEHDGLNRSTEQTDQNGIPSKKCIKKVMSKNDSDKILIKLPIGKRLRQTTTKTKPLKGKQARFKKSIQNKAFAKTIQLDNTESPEDIEEDQAKDDNVKTNIGCTDLKQSKQLTTTSTIVQNQHGTTDLASISKEDINGDYTKRNDFLSEEIKTSGLEKKCAGGQFSMSSASNENLVKLAGCIDMMQSPGATLSGRLVPSQVCNNDESPNNVGSSSFVSDVATSEEDIYMLCTPNSKSASNSNDMVRKLTPKQIARRQENEKRNIEKLKEQITKRRKLQEEKKEKAHEKKEQERLRRKVREEKEEQKRKERVEKEEMKRKEREEKEEIKRKEKEMKDKKRQVEIEQKTEGKRQKEEERKRKDEQKEEERKKREGQKEGERKRKEEEKEAEEKRKQKVVQAFTSFFVKKVANGIGAIKGSDDENSLDSSLGASTSATGIPLVHERFMPFCVKGDMRLAPVVRRMLEPIQKRTLEYILADRSEPSEFSAENLYLELVKRNVHKPSKTGRTWCIDEEEEENDDIMIIDDTVCHQIEEDPAKLKQKLKAKFFMFEENRRPPFRGTWRNRSSYIGPRRPLAKDTKYFNYEIDSDEEWEEEEPGESLHGSDDEKDIDPDEEYEVDNEFFVPHGHLSDEELQVEEKGASDDNDPDMQKAKLKIMQQEFVAEMKKKTEKIKPRLFGCIWETRGLYMRNHEENQGIVQDRQVECSAIIWKMLNERAMLYDADEPISFTSSSSASTGIRNGVIQELEVSSPGKENDKGPKKIRITEDAVKDLVMLVHGNVNNRKFLVREFQTFWSNRITSKGSSKIEGDNMARMPETRYGVEFSLESIRNKIREIAEWGACPLEGPMMGKLCWTVDKSVLAQYGLQCLDMPNNWKYNLKGNKQVKLEKNLSVTNIDSGQQNKHTLTKKEKAIASKLGHMPANASANCAASTVTIKKFTNVLPKNEQLSGSTKLWQTSTLENSAQEEEKAEFLESSLNSDRNNFSGRGQTKKRVQRTRLNHVPRDLTSNQPKKSNVISKFLAKDSSKHVSMKDKPKLDCSFNNEVIEIDSA